MALKIKIWVFGVLFIGGALVGGSDGPFFPWPNLAGGGMIILSVLVVFWGGDALWAYLEGVDDGDEHGHDA